MLTELFLKMLNRKAASPRSEAGRIIAGLGLAPGLAVADIGSGGGYFSLEFARLVGPTGRVYAVDHKSTNLGFVKRRASGAGLNNITFVLAEKNGVDLPEASLDLIFSRNSFHHLADPAGYFCGLAKALKPTGAIVIIDHAPGQGFGLVRFIKHFTPQEKIDRTMASCGFRLGASYDFLPGQTFTVWRPA